ncbi:uncharacterized protein LOC120637812 [Pararge aegeria]|uniref:Jg15235 protein n=2 Tax=Pararge aegeria TaxID=116150 RepID=A0A8S4RBM6_9NEOP|nr:uncharacterized protein LOC120637812 [Pararge aegeria]CAH2234640.1 jg15235 [Pararge aegeria aegeria]
MAIGVDTSKWKPRKFKGTPAGKARNIVGLCIASVGCLIGAFYQFSDVTVNYRKKLDIFYQDPIEEVERKLMIASGLPNRTGATIRRLMEEEARPDRPDK